MEHLGHYQWPLVIKKNFTIIAACFNTDNVLLQHGFGAFACWDKKLLHKFLL